MSQNSQQKILNKDNLKKKVLEWQSNGERIVFSNGCFDILHVGHVDYLEKARNLGDRLVMGLNTDASVSRIKGPERPIVPEFSRSRVMASLASVDAVCFFDDETPLELISFLKPDILVKGDDYSIETIIGSDVVIANGGEVKTIPLVEGFSTSNIVNKIKNT